MKRRILYLVAALYLATSAFAVIASLKVFTTTYKIGASSTLGKSKCAACHVGQTAKLNPYGADIKKAMAGKKPLTAAILKKVESMDSDKDGASNITEIRADKLPGDAKSKP